LNTTFPLDTFQISLLPQAVRRYVIEVVAVVARDT
jgi:hypothetical protein